MLIMPCKCITVQVLASLARACVYNQQVQISLQQNGQKQITETTLSFKFCVWKWKDQFHYLTRKLARKTSIGHRAVLDKGTLDRSFLPDLQRKLSFPPSTSPHLQVQVCPTVEDQ